MSEELIKLLHHTIVTKKEIELNPLHYSEFSGYKKSFKSPASPPISQMHIHIENFIPSSNKSCF